MLPCFWIMNLHEEAQLFWKAETNMSIEDCKELLTLRIRVQDEDWTLRKDARDLAKRATYG
jgi:hypothetical protein